MTNKLVFIINSLKVTKIKKILLYEMKFLVPNYSCLQNPWLGGYRPQIPFCLSSALNWICWTPSPSEQIFCVQDCTICIHSLRKLEHYTVTNTNVYSSMHSRWKSLQPLCSWSGYRPAAKQQFFFLSLVRSVFSHMGDFFMHVSHCQK